MEKRHLPRPLNAEEEVFLLRCYRQASEIVASEFLSPRATNAYSVLGARAKEILQRIRNRIEGREAEEKSSQLNTNEEDLLRRLYERVSAMKREGGLKNGKSRLSAFVPRLSEEAIKKAFGAKSDISECLCNANTGMIRKMAWSYNKSKENRSIDVQDFVQVGNMAVFERAVPYFNLSYGVKFLSFAVNWIDQAMMRHLAYCGRGIRQPFYVFTDLRRIKEFAGKFRVSEGREPEMEDVIKNLEGIRSIPLELFFEEQRMASLDAVLSSDSTRTMTDKIPDNREKSSETKISGSETGIMAHKIVELLSGDKDGRLYQTIVMRFGIYGDIERTLDDVARKFGVTRERVRQLQNTGIKKMRRLAKKLGLSADDF